MFCLHGTDLKGTGDPDAERKAGADMCRRMSTLGKRGNQDAAGQKGHSGGTCGSQGNGRSPGGSPVSWIGQACGSIHTESHAVGLVFYELSAIVRKEGIEHCRETVEAKTKWYMQTLQACSDRESELRKQTWAAFLLKDRPNKEAVLLEREKKQ